jgi:hypothetical protein
MIASMDNATRPRKAIFLRPDAIDDLIDPFDRLSEEAKARIIGLPNGTWFRLARRGGNAGGKAIVAIIEGMSDVAEQLGKPAPRFDDLFEIRESTMNAT